MKKLYPYIRLAMLCLLMTISFSTIFSQQVAKSIRASTGDQIGFLEYKPSTYDKDVSTKYPLIIFLHGIGERGNGTTDLQNITLWGIPKRIKQGYGMRTTWNGKTESFLVLSPQCPAKYGMWPAAIIDDLIKYAKQNLRIDPNRIILTGLSMGGGGTLRYISDALPDDPKNIAAAAPISSPCTFNTGKNAAAANLPVWCFHAQDDPTASVTCTMNAITGLNAWNPAVKPLLTLWPTGGHEVWDRLYEDTTYKYQDVVSIYEWFLAQNKSLPVNKLPIARAGTDITVPPGVLQLNGSASSDPDGKIVRYVWKKLSGPASGTITTARGTAPSTTVTGVTLAGTYLFELAVADDRAAFTRDTIKITVNSNSQPQKGPVPGNGTSALVPNAGADATIYTSWNQTILNGTLTTSTDKSVWISSTRWTKVSGPATSTITNPSAINTNVTNLVAGVYVFRATFTDNKGGTAYDDKTVTVLAGAGTATTKSALVPNAGADATIYTSWNQTILNGTLTTSTDKSVWISSTRWTKVSGPATSTITNPSAINTNVTNLVAGVYVFRATFTDNMGGTAYDDKTVTVLTGAGTATTKSALVPNAGADATIYTSWNQTILNGTLTTSTDKSVWISSTRWTKVSGPATSTITNPSAINTNVTNLVAGVYVFRATFTDNKGGTAYDDKTVTVLAGAGTATTKSALVPNAGADATIYTSWNQTILNGTLTTSTDKSVWISSTRWTKVSGPATSTITNPSAINTNVTNLVAGVYVFRATFTDNMGGTAYDDKTVTVLAGAGTASQNMVLDNSELPPANNLTEGKLSIYPNPAVSIIHLQYSFEGTGKMLINIYDVSGKKVKTIETEKTQQVFLKDIDVSDLKKGIYFVMTGTDKYHINSVKLIKE